MSQQEVESIKSEYWTTLEQDLEASRTYQPQVSIE